MSTPLNPKKHYRGGDKKLEGMKVSEVWGEIKVSIIFWIWHGHYSHRHKATMSTWWGLHKNRWNGGDRMRKRRNKKRKKGNEIRVRACLTRKKGVQLWVRWEWYWLFHGGVNRITVMWDVLLYMYSFYRLMNNIVLANRQAKYR